MSEDNDVVKSHAEQMAYQHSVDPAQCEKRDEAPPRQQDEIPVGYAGSSAE